MKKAILIILALAVLSVLLPSVALGDSITNIRGVAQANGTTLLRWDANNSGGQYKVTWKLDYCEWGTYDNCNSNFFTLENLIPGETYTITVERGNDSGSIVYTAPRGIFKEWNTSGKQYISLSEDKKQHKTSLQYFSLSDLRANPTRNFYVFIDHPDLKKERRFAMLVAMKTPLGYTRETLFFDPCVFVIRSLYSYFPSNLLDDWLKYVEQDYGAIPTGRYSFEVYLDGNLYSSAEFTISN